MIDRLAIVLFILFMLNTLLAILSLLRLATSWGDFILWSFFLIIWTIVFLLVRYIYRGEK